MLSTMTSAIPREPRASDRPKTKNGKPRFSPISCEALVSHRKGGTAYEEGVLALIASLKAGTPGLLALSAHESAVLERVMDLKVLFHLSDERVKIVDEIDPSKRRIIFSCDSHDDLLVDAVEILSRVTKVVLQLLSPRFRMRASAARGRELTTATTSYCSRWTTARS